MKGLTVLSSHNRQRKGEVLLSEPQRPEPPPEVGIEGQQGPELSSPADQRKGAWSAGRK